MATRADRMLDTFSTFFAAGKGIGTGLRGRRKRKAFGEYQELKAQGIPTMPGSVEESQQLQQLREQALPMEGWDPNSPYAQRDMEFDTAAAQTELEAQPAIREGQTQGYLQTRANYMRNLADAQAKMAQYMEPEDFQKFQQGEAQAQIDKFKRGAASLAMTADLYADGKATPEQLVEVANQTYNDLPNGVMGIASVVNGEPMMSFFSEGTGSRLGTVPIPDGDAIMKMAAFYDKPDAYLEFELKEDDVRSEIKHRTKQQEWWEDQIEIKQVDAMWQLLDDDATRTSAMAKNSAGRNVLNMTNSEYNAHVDDTWTAAGVWRDDNPDTRTAYNQMQAVWQGLDFQTWNIDKMGMTPQIAASVGGQWQDAINASIPNVLSKKGFPADDPIVAEVQQYEDSNGAVLGPNLATEVLLDMQDRGLMGYVDDGRGNKIPHFKISQGQEVRIPPSVLGQADPLNGVGVYAMKAQNMATGSGMFSNLSPKLRQQAIDFISGMADKWTRERGFAGDGAGGKPEGMRAGIATAQTTTTPGPTQSRAQRDTNARGIPDDFVGPPPPGDFNFVMRKLDEAVSQEEIDGVLQSPMFERLTGAQKVQARQYVRDRRKDSAAFVGPPAPAPAIPPGSSRYQRRKLRQQAGPRIPTPYTGPSPTVDDEDVRRFGAL